MTPPESAQLGEQNANVMMEAIDVTMQIPGLQKDFWWCGFLATMSARCYVEIGPAAHAVLARTLQDSLAKLTGKNETKQ